MVININISVEVRYFTYIFLRNTEYMKTINIRQHYTEFTHKDTL